MRPDYFLSKRSFFTNFFLNLKLTKKNFCILPHFVCQLFHIFSSNLSRNTIFILPKCRITNLVTVV